MLLICKHNIIRYEDYVVCVISSIANKLENKNSHIFNDHVSLIWMPLIRTVQLLEDYSEEHKI
jgi:hypothetical protein